MGCLDVVYARDTDAIQFMKEQLGNTGRKQPTIASLEQKLVAMRPANSKFLRLFLTYAMSFVLAPTTGIRVSPRFYPLVINIKEAKNLNMCWFVIMMLCKVLQPDGDKEKTDPCMLYLMVKYLDSLELNGIEISEEGTRVSVWTNAMVRKAINEDTKPDGTFGVARLKQEFQRIEGTSEEDTSRSRDVHEQQTDSTSEGNLNDSSEQTFGYEDEQYEPSCIM
ncbi:hypothetical protein ACQ4PT_039494 [Festuca glaucescens]